MNEMDLFELGKELGLLGVLFVMVLIWWKVMGKNMIEATHNLRAVAQSAERAAENAERAAVECKAATDSAERTAKLHERLILRAEATTDGQ